jgi:hypothetical protein
MNHAYVPCFVDKSISWFCFFLSSSSIEVSGHFRFDKSSAPATCVLAVPSLLIEDDIFALTDLLH